MNITQRKLEPPKNPWGFQKNGPYMLMEKIRWTAFAGLLFFVFQNHALAAGELPIEVLGPQGTKATVTIELTDVSNIDTLYLQCHACGYNDSALDKDASRTKASLIINNGARIPLKHYTGHYSGTGERPPAIGNAAITVLEPEKGYGGIGGGFHTVRMTLPISTPLVVGNNTFTFEHTNADTRSLGFRIIALQLRRGTVPVTPVNPLTFDSPASWTPPLTGAANLQDGENLWSRRNSLYDPDVAAKYGTLVNQTLRGRIHASCADCHARDGRDLRYFRYSNKSIVERAKYHGLTETQGKKIASYIRSLNTPAPAAAWPWNPPYQPGPGIDSKDIRSWAAGAGVNAVLNSDKDMEPYLFPPGKTVAEVVDRYSTLNMRELPVAMQFPDWNSWLPQVHPLDAFDRNDATVLTDEMGRTKYTKPYFEVLYDNVRVAPTAEQLDGMMGSLVRWVGRGADCYSQRSFTGPGWRANDGLVLRSESSGFALAPDLANQVCTDYWRDPSKLWAVEASKKSLMSWITVKHWEIIHSRSATMEAAAQNIGNVCSSGRCINASEARGWGMQGSTVFLRAPHFLGFDAKRFLDQDQLVGTYTSTAWYQLQLVVNSGFRKSLATYFPYHLVYLDNLAVESKVWDSHRYWSSIIKMRQVQTNGTYGVSDGLTLRTAQPYWLYSNGSLDSNLQRAVGATRWKQITEALLKDFVAEANNATVQDWANASGLDDVQDQFSTDFSVWNGKGDIFQNGDVQGRNTKRVIPYLRTDVGVDPAVLNSLIDWGQKTWPNGNWDEVR